MTTASPTTLGASLVRPELQHEIEQFLYDEADLLDANDYDGWLELMAPDIHYWMPGRSNRLSRERDLEFTAPNELAFFDENHEDLAQRVRRMHTGMAWAEDPPSRVRHLITNVRVRTTPVPDEFEVESSFFLYRTRLEREMDQFVGKRCDLLRRSDERTPFVIARRKIIIDMSTILAKNLSTFM
jgi:biphenyl 2,3-dioxygenase beta subunit